MCEKLNLQNRKTQTTLTETLRNDEHAQSQGLV